MQLSPFRLLSVAGMMGQGGASRSGRRPSGWLAGPGCAPIGNVTQPSRPLHSAIRGGMSSR